LEDEERFCLPEISIVQQLTIHSRLFREWRKESIMALCPECEAEVTLQGVLVGEIIYCPDCNAELEVLDIEHPAVALAPQVEEDWGE
jgi:alpha-aminoadipate carrier protein LysW